MVWRQAKAGVEFRAARCAAKALALAAIFALALCACGESAEPFDASLQGETVEALTLDSALVEGEPLDLASGVFELRSFSVSGTAFESLSGDTLYLKLPYDAALIGAAIRVRASKEALVRFGDSLFSDTAFTADLLEPVWMTLVSSAGDSLKYLVMPYFSNLPVVFVHTPGGAAVESKVRWVEDTKIVIGNAGARNAEFSGASIRGRGNSTWLYEKKPYALKFSKRSQVLGMKPHKRWCLLANYIDKTLLRNALTFEVGRHTNSLEWTPTGEFVDLVLNGVLLGNYYLCEQIRVDENRLAITEMSSSDLGEASITGGYLLEYDTGYDETYKFYSQTFKLPVNLKEPDGDVMVEEQFEYIKAYVNGMEEALASGDAAAWSEYLDYATFADYWIVQAVTGNRDVTNPRSAYFYKERGEVLKAGPLWDFDYRTYLPDNTEILKDYLYYGALFGDSAFVELVKERFAEYYPRFLALTAFIEEEAELLAESAANNEALWPEISKKINGDTELSPGEAWARLEAAYVQRLEFLNAEIVSW